MDQDWPEPSYLLIDMEPSGGSLQSSSCLLRLISHALLIREYGLDRRRRYRVC